MGEASTARVACKNTNIQVPRQGSRMGNKAEGAKGGMPPFILLKWVSASVDLLWLLIKMPDFSSCNSFLGLHTNPQFLSPVAKSQAILT